MIGNILKYSVSSLFWGILIAIACISIFLFLVKGWYKNAYFKPITYIIVVILGLILCYNCTVICGAIAMKSDISFFESLIAQIIDSSFFNTDAVVDRETSNEIIQEALKDHPILYYYVGAGNFEGWKLSDLPHVMADALNSFLNKVILKNILWSLGFVVVGAILAIRTIGRGGRSGLSSRSRSSRKYSDYDTDI